jgi:hypothetical protein
VTKFDELVADRVDSDLASEIKDAVHSLDTIQVAELTRLLALINVE